MGLILKEICSYYEVKDRTSDEKQNYVHDSDRNEIVKSISGVNYIDSYQGVNEDGTLKPIENYNGFYIKIGNKVLTVYCSKNEFYSGYYINISIINRDKRTKSYVGGGYGSTPIVFEHEDYVLQLEQISMYRKNQIIKMLNEVVENFNNVFK